MRVPVQYSISRMSARVLSTIVLIAVVCGGIVSADVHSATTALSTDNSTTAIWLPGLNTPLTNEQQIYPDYSYGDHIYAKIARIFAAIIYPVMMHNSGSEDRFTFISNTIPDETGITYHSTAVFRPANSPSISSGNTSSMQNTSSTTITTTTENQDIIDTAPHNSGNSSRETVQEPWIKIYPIGTAQKNTIRVSGTTNLPDGEMIGVAAMTTIFHPSPKNYDSSHEIAETNTTVQWKNTTTRGFSCSIDASLLRPGEYFLEVWAYSERYNIEKALVFNLLPQQSPTPRPSNIIDWEDLRLPPLTVNTSMKPILLTNKVVLVPADERTQRHEIPYGATIVLSTDGVFRVFDNEGTQIEAFYDSHALHITEVPNDAMVRHEEHVITVDLGEERILTRIYEADTV